MRQMYEYAEISDISGPVQLPGPSLPPPPSVARPDLVRRIEEGMAGRLVLLSAPAGWGKSSVLAEWSHRTSINVAWVNCEGISGDAGRFLRNLVQAIDRVCPGFGRDLFPMFRTPRPLAADQVLGVLEGALLEHLDPIAIVLDDFHAVTSPEVVAGIWSLVTSGPSNVRFLIASRTSPSWPLARRRATGDVTEISARDLAFTPDETISLLQAECADQDVARLLQQRSEGWVTGLRLAQLWLRHMDSLPAVESAFRGSHRDISDYLAEEVLKYLPPETERFLMLTSVLDSISAPLAAVVTESERAGSILDDIEQQGLFLVPLDNERRWYRYHGVFREFLQARLARRDPGAEADILRRAGAWYAGEGLFVEAASCLLRAQSYEDAAEVIERCASCLLLRAGETSTLVEYAEALPKEVLRRRPAVGRYYAWALVLVGRLDEAESLARELEEDDSALWTDAARRAEIASIRSRVAAYRGDHDATIRHAEIAMADAGPAESWFRADVLLSLGFAYRGKGEIDRASELFGQASRLGWESGFAHAALWGSRYQAVTYVSQGRLRDAEALIERDMERARRAGMDRGAAFAALLVGRGELRYERSELEAAREDFLQALELAQAVGDAKILMNVYVALGILEDAEGHVVAARDAARRAVAVFDGSGERAVEALIALHHDDWSEVRRWMDEYIAQEGSEPSPSCGESEQIMLGRALIALGDPEVGTAFLSSLLDAFEQSGRHGRALVVQVLLASAAEASGDEESATMLAGRVVDLAMREGYVRSILDEGPAFLRVLRRAMRRDPSASRRRYATMLFSTTEPAGNDVPPQAPGSLVEPLTPRQEEVLRLMAEGRSNREISDALYVAEGTIKAHVHQIFGKLMVRNRTEAIRAAQQLGLAG